MFSVIMKQGFIMRLTQLQYFIRVSELGSINATSRDLHVTQPAISTSIRNLEDELGIELFTRSRQRMDLTEAGSMFYQRVKRAVSLLEEAKAEAQGYSPDRETVRVGIPPMIGLMYIPAIIRQFNLKHPEISLRVTEANTRELSQKLNGNEIDFALMIGESPYSTWFERKKLLDTCYSFYVGPDNPLASSEMVSLDELAKVPLILFDTGLFLNQYIAHAFDDSRYRPKVAFASSQINSVKTYVRESSGGTFLIRECVQDADGLIEVPTEITPSISIVAAWLKGVSLSSPASKLLHFLENQYR